MPSANLQVTAAVSINGCHGNTLVDLTNDGVKLLGTAEFVQVGYVTGRDMVVK